VSDKNKRCVDCGIPCTGTRCEKHEFARRAAPIPPCVGCGRPLHRKSTPLEERGEGSRFVRAEGRCDPCLQEARRRGLVPRSVPRTTGYVQNGVQKMRAKAALTKEEWQEARCAEVDPELFFPEQGAAVTAAKKICRTCEIRERCLEVALANNEEFGIFGGLSAVERQRLRAQRRRRADRERREGVGA
jgi:WhiB family redox-sensing transcriptional regulator